MKGDLSRIQERALGMLIIHEQEEHSKGQTEEMKLALLSAGVPLEVLFPEMVPESAKVERAEEAFDSDGPIEWVSASPEEAADVLEKLRQLQGEGVLEADDILIDPQLMSE